MLRSTPVVFLSVVTLSTAYAAPQKIIGRAWSTDVAKTVNEYIRQNHILGATVSISMGSDQNWSEGFGSSDIENTVPARADTMYPLASVSKSITAVAALQLVSAGKIDLHAPIQQYCPQFPVKDAPITTWHLLLHTSGIRHKNAQEDANAIHFSNIVSTFRLFQDDALVARPGVKFSYTSFGYNVLGCVIEGASGLSFVNYLKKNVFEPTGMTLARQDSDQEIIFNRARGYSKREDGTLVNAGIYDTSITVPGGGLMSSADDLTAFARALFANTLLSKDMLDLAFRGYVAIPGTDASMSAGWAVMQYEARTEVFSTGSNPKVSSLLYLVPSEKLAVAILGNMPEKNFLPLARQVAAIARSQADRISVNLGTGRR